jgi:hypothetical protein
MGKSFFLALWAALVLAAPIRAEDASSKALPGWTLTKSAGGSVNPLGLASDNRVFYTLPLFPGLSGALWDSSRIEAGFHDTLSPAFAAISAFVRFEPLAVFDLYASAGLRGYYDFFGFGYTPLAGYGAAWDSEARKDADRSSAAGFRYSFAATAKGAVGPFVFASATGCTVYDMFQAPGCLDYYYDPASDTALKLFDGFLTNDSLAMYTFVPEGEFLVRGGLVHTFLYVPGSDYVSRRLCLAGRIEADAAPAARGFVTLLAGVFLQDRYNSWKDGNVYAGVQAGVTVKL